MDPAPLPKPFPQRHPPAAPTHLHAMSATGKTKKAAAKRFKRTGTGKLKFHSPGSRHLLTGKTRKRKRRLAKAKYLCAGDAARYNL